MCRRFSVGRLVERALVAAGGAALLALLAPACGGSSPSSPSSSPGAETFEARVTVTVDGSGAGIAIQSLSEVRVDASASLATGPLFVVKYGDGAESQQAVSTHTYESAGTYTVSVTVLDSKGRSATTTRAVTVRSMVGTWFNATFDASVGAARVRRFAITSQAGRAVTGEYSEVPSGTTNPLTGALEAGRMIRLKPGGGPEVTGTISGLVSGEEGATLLVRGFGGGDLTFQPVVGVPTGADPVARLDISVDDYGSTSAVARFTPIRFGGVRSGGSGLVYVTEFGDGLADSTGPVTTHACQKEGVLTARLIVVDRFGRSSVAESQYGCRSSLGWECLFGVGMTNGYWNPVAQRSEFRLLRRESGDSVAGAGTGWYRHPEGNESHLTWRLTAPQNITLTLDDGTMEFTGPMILGRGSCCDSNWRLSVRGGSANGATLSFIPYDPY